MQNRPDPALRARVWLHQTTCGPGVKIMNCETGQVAWHLEVRYSDHVFFDY